MPTFKIDVAMDIRAYGYVEIEAEDIDAAVKIATPDFIRDNFNPHGGGSDDFDYSSPRDIWLGDFECEETGEAGFVEKDLPNSHYPGGLVQDAAPDMLAALKALYEQCAMTQKYWGDGANTRAADEAIAAGLAAIAKAEGA